MTQFDAATARAAKRFSKMEYDKQVAGAGAQDDGSAGPPYWNRSAWDRFYADKGFYPFGMQQGAMVYPETFEGAPDWVFELMGIRKPPVSVTLGSAGANYAGVGNLPLWGVERAPK